MSTQQTVLKRGFVLPGFKIHRLKNHPFIVPVTTFLVLFFISVIAFISTNGQTIGAADSHVVHLSIDGKQQVIPTRATNVKDLLNRLNVTVNKQDIITPGLDTPIYDDNFSVDIKKAKPVMIVDGTKKTITLSAQTNARQLANEAGIVTTPEDKVETKPIELISPRQALMDGIASEQVVIDRATATNLNLYGSSISVRTHADTVGELLAEKNIKPAEGDTITPALDTPLKPDTQIFVVRVGHQVVSVEEVIPAPVESTDDPNATMGSVVVKEAGSDGKKITTYEIELRNDKEVSRRSIQEVIVSAPTKRVVVKGSKVVYSNPSANVELGRQIAEQMGVSGEFSCVYQIFQRESGWNHTARNRSSGAYGIPQSLPASKMGPNYEDPAVQIRWGINYMINRYGSPCKANAFWNANHWY